MRHYVVMGKDECGDDFRADEREFEYPDFDENDEFASELCDRWKSAVVDMVRAAYKGSEIWNFWIERVDREKYGYDFIANMAYVD